MTNSVFSLDTFTCRNVLSTNTLNKSLMNESYFVTALNYISECKKEYRQYSKELYKNILECTDHDVINESFSEFTQKIKEVIQKFLKFIKSIYDRFMLSLNKMAQSDRYLDKNKGLLKNFSDKHEFTIKGYNYTFSDNIPLINARAAFDEDFIGLNFDFDNAKNDKEIVAYINKQHGKLNGELSNYYYDKFRAEVIGKDPQDGYSITQEEFADELFEVFREGTSTQEDITVTYGQVLDSLSFYEKYKTIKKSIEKTKDTLDKEYKSIEKSLDRLISKNANYDVKGSVAVAIDPEYNGQTSVQVSANAYAKLNVLIKAKITQVVEMSNIHAMAFSYKLDAITECYKQDKKIIYGALTQLSKDRELLK